MREVDVPIAGGGPVGLTASILLSRLGVASLLVERHPGTSIHPEARGINARTMEIYRQCGGEPAVRAAGLAHEQLALHRARSRVRETLGIAMRGHAGIYGSLNVLLRADLTAWVADRPAALLLHRATRAEGDVPHDQRGEPVGFPRQQPPRRRPARRLHARALRCHRPPGCRRGRLHVDILGVVPWTAAAQVAECYRDGRIFLAGDAAHHMPPTGGFGLNTGVQDVHNLAWKLAAVLSGWAGPGLLATYEDERLPYGRAITEQSLANARSLGRGEPTEPAPTGNLARPEFLNGALRVRIVQGPTGADGERRQRHRELVRHGPGLGAPGCAVRASQQHEAVTEEIEGGQPGTSTASRPGAPCWCGPTATSAGVARPRAPAPAASWLAPSADCSQFPEI